MPERSTGRKRAKPAHSLRHLPAAKRQAPDGLRPHLLEVMEERGLDAAELAQAIDVETQFVRDLVRGRVLRIRLRNYPVMQAIARQLRVPFDDLYPVEWLAWLDQRLFANGAGLLEQARVRMGLEIRELAEEAGLPEYLLQQLERGEIPWLSRTRAQQRLAPVARLLGVKTADLLSGVRVSAPLAERKGLRPPPLPAGWPPLWEWRAAANLTRRGFAHQAHVTLEVLAALENGRGVSVERTALMGSLERIAAALGRPLEAVATPVLLEACRRTRAEQDRVRPPDLGWPDVRGLRYQAGLTDTELAKRASIPYEALRALERGVGLEVEAPRLDGFLLRLARELGCDYETLATPALVAACAQAQQAAKTEGPPSLPAGWPALWTWRHRAGYSVMRLAKLVRAQPSDLNALERGLPINRMARTVRTLATRLADTLGQPVPDVYTPALARACAELRAAQGLKREH
jgi:transcriptional regulator with XRE-family HTH domain